MIPRKIHYCWFGGNEMPELGRKCIESWKKYCPDYEIVLWNEDNYDLDACPYVREAYEAKKWAFVSDYARFDILYKHGGVYFDTDVELLKPIDEIIEKGAFMGCEVDAFEGKGLKVAPGLGIAAEAGDNIYRTILEGYHTRHFTLDDGSYDLLTVVDYTTNILRQYGLKDCEGMQNIAGINIYPKEYFNPFDTTTGKISTTPNTYSIHHYAASWTSTRNKINTKISRFINRLAGK